MLRLQKYMAQCGIASRRKCELLIQAKRVTVNGQTVTEQGTRVSDDDVVALDGKTLHIQKEKRYYLFFKPRLVISSSNDSQGRKTVLDYFSDMPRVYCVGRLDYDTEGLILLTNDGELANRIMHPRYEMEKEYYFLLDSTISEDEKSQLLLGVRSEGDFIRPDKIEILSNEGRARGRIVLHEGKNREVRRLFKAIGKNVLALRRERIGFLTLKGLKSGERRPLTEGEITRLLSECGLESST